MKKITFSLSFLLLAFCLPAQGYLPLVQENAHWIMRAWGDCNDYHYIHVMRGDTAIDGTTYKKVYQLMLSNDYWQPLEAPYFVQDEILVAAVREDLTERKVYARAFGWDWWQCPGDVEQLIYDFSVEVGDTTSLCTTVDPEYPAIVDTILTEALYGENRTVFYSDRYGDDIYETFKMIEGIGSQHGLLNPTLYFGTGFACGDYFQDYCQGTDVECGIFPVSATETLEQYKILVSPNPATDHLQIRLPKLIRNGHLQLLSFDGSILLEQAISSGMKETAIDLQVFANGIYLIQFWENGKLLTKERFIVQR